METALVRRRRRSSLPTESSLISESTLSVTLWMDKSEKVARDTGHNDASGGEMAEVKSEGERDEGAVRQDRRYE